MLNGVLVVVPASRLGKVGGLHGVAGVFEEGEDQLDCGLKGSRLLVLKTEPPALEG
jgi:hypothetical protein